ncbi:MAG: hypothetical protein ABR576_00685 [Thermoanaerobaculia bacterium]
MISEIPLANRMSDPVGVTAGPDGDVWFTDSLQNAIGRVTAGTPAGSYFTIPPCRLADTRAPDGHRGGPPLAAGFERLFPAAGTCGIPATATAVSVNVTVTQPGSDGHVTIYPGGMPLPGTPTVHFRSGQTRAGNGVVAIVGTGALAVTAGHSTGTVHLVIDTAGYFH